LSSKIKHIINKYPQLTGKEDFIQVVLDIREAFKLGKVPFSISVGDWCSGSLEKYYKGLRLDKEKFRKKKKRRRGWVKY
jgi:hypothetical protein